MSKVIKKKKLVRVFANELAELQKKADRWYYEENDQDMSSYILARVTPLQDLTNKLGITSEVYKEAYKIYDFRNSGKEGYIPDLMKG